MSCNLTEKIYKLDTLYERGIETTDDFYTMPILKPESFIPEKIVGFSDLKNYGPCDFGVHFFLDDHRFEQVWSHPMKYLNKMKRAQCVFSPDYSLYIGMPTAMSIWNAYRNRFLGALYQSYGLKVIPTVVWGDEDTYDFAFAGLPKNSVLAITTLGVCRYELEKKYFRNGVAELIKRLEPSDLLVYGQKLEFDSGNAKVHWYPNEIIARLREVTKRQKMEKEREKKEKEEKSTSQESDVNKEERRAS